MLRFVGAGADVIAVARIRDVALRRGSRFLERFLHPLELDRASRLEGPARDQYLASRWALKEAVLKACGSWRLPFPQMRLEAGCSVEVVPEGQAICLAAEIRRTGKGPHVVVFDGSSALLVADQRLEVSASLSHDDDTAFAVALCHRREAPA